jgi:AAA domain-containing protein
MTAASPPPYPLEAEGGAVPLGSPFYVRRPTDGEFERAVLRGDSIVLVKGARQMGKTSLLARGLQQAREAGVRVVLTDFQTLAPGDLASSEALLLALARLIAEQLDLDACPEEGWDPDRGPNSNVERYLRREVLEALDEPLVWGLDEVDRLFTCPFSGEIFAMFRSWHNRRALEPDSPWRKLSLAISFATEAHLFIRDLSQSPFNVGTRVLLRDFTREEVEELNRRYGAPLRSAAEVKRFYALLAGHPFLSRRALHELATGTPFRVLMDRASHDDGPFGDHLRRMLVVLARDPELLEATRRALVNCACLSPEQFQRLRSAGVLAGESAGTARPRCGLFGTYLLQHL